MSHSAPEAGTGTDPAAAAGQGEPNGEEPGQTQGDPTDGATPEDGQEDQTDWKAETERWKRLSRENEARAKQNSAAARRLKEIEDANKTELEKAQERAAEAERERDEARNGHSRIMAAATHDLPVELIDLLGSGTEDEIDERAAVMASAIQDQARTIAEETVQTVRRAVEALGIPWPIDDGGNGSGNGSARTAAGAAAFAQRPVESLLSGASGRRTTTTNPEELFRTLINDQ